MTEMEFEPELATYARVPIGLEVNGYRLAVERDGGDDGVVLRVDDGEGTLAGGAPELTT